MTWLTRFLNWLSSWMRHPVYGLPTPAHQSEPITNPSPPTVKEQPAPAPPVAVAPPPPVPVQPPKPLPKPKPVQSKWWRGTFNRTQGYGCTSLAMEGHNPNHPECAFFHEGEDFALPCGTPIYAGCDVHVLAVDPAGYGRYQDVKGVWHGENAALHLGAVTHDIWLYHMARYAVKAGDHVRAGSILGWSGTRGFSTGCHIHFEVRPVGGGYRHSVNPASFL